MCANSAIHAPLVSQRYMVLSKKHPDVKHADTRPALTQECIIVAYRDQEEEDTHTLQLSVRNIVKIYSYHVSQKQFIDL